MARWAVVSCGWWSGADSRDVGPHLNPKHSTRARLALTDLLRVAEQASVLDAMVEATRKLVNALKSTLHSDF